MMGTTTGAASLARSALLAALAIAAAMPLAACGSDDDGSGGGGEGGGLSGGGSQDAASGGTIKIGLLSTLEGPFAPFGRLRTRGAEVALLEMGGKLEGTGPRDGVGGARAAAWEIELVIESSDATPDVAVEATRRLVEQNKVDVVVGPLSGDEGLAIKNYAKQHPDVTFVNGTSRRAEHDPARPGLSFFRYTTDGAQWMAAWASTPPGEARLQEGRDGRRGHSVPVRPRSAS